MCKEDQRIKKEKVSIRHYICKAVGCMLHLWVLRPDIMYATSKTSRKKKIKYSSYEDWMKSNQNNSGIWMKDNK